MGRSWISLLSGSRRASSKHGHCKLIFFGQIHHMRGRTAKTGGGSHVAGMRAMPRPTRYRFKYTLLTVAPIRTSRLIWEGSAQRPIIIWHCWVAVFNRDHPALVNEAGQKKISTSFLTRVPFSSRPAVQDSPDYLEARQENPPFQTFKGQSMAYGYASRSMVIKFHQSSLTVPRATEMTTSIYFAKCNNNRAWQRLSYGQ